MAGEIETLNKFVVATDGRSRIVFPAFAVPRELTFEDALNLAAYLVSMADTSEGHERFHAVLAAVESA